MHTLQREGRGGEGREEGEGRGGEGRRGEGRGGRGEEGRGGEGRRGEGSGGEGRGPTAQNSGWDAHTQTFFCTGLQPKHCTQAHPTHLPVRGVRVLFGITEQHITHALPAGEGMQGPCGGCTTAHPSQHTPSHNKASLPCRARGELCPPMVLVPPPISPPL